MIQAALFEHPLALFVVCAVVELVLARRWAQIRTSATAQTALIGLLLTVTLPVVSILVVTDRERIKETCRLAGNAIDDGNVEALKILLDPAFNSDGIDGNEFLRRVEDTLTRYRVDRVGLRNFEIEIVNRGEAVATFDASCAVRSADAYSDSIPTRWRLQFRRSGDHWLIHAVQAIPIPPFYFRGVTQPIE